MKSSKVHNAVVSISQIHHLYTIYHLFPHSKPSTCYSSFKTLVVISNQRIKSTVLMLQDGNDLMLSAGLARLDYLGQEQRDRGKEHSIQENVTMI